MYTEAKDIIYSFIQSIDLFNFLLKNHHRRVAIISYHIGRVMKLDEVSMGKLILAAALHDIGAISIVERNQLIEMDIHNPHPHARLGCYMIESFKPFSELATIIFYHHWNYQLDQQYYKAQGPVPIESYIIHLADRVDIAIDQTKPILLQTVHVTEEITKRAQSLFHPEVYQAFLKASDPDRFWLDIDNTSMRDILENIKSDILTFSMTIDILEDLAYTISKLIDCRSAYTIAHSFGVSEVAYKIAQICEMDELKCRKIKIAGLLHDIGKIGISTEILEKKGPLTVAERKHIQEHAYYTGKILRIPKELSEIADWASHHHETHKGKGYPDNLIDKDITLEMDILSYADIFTALSENRPYRTGMSLPMILKTMEDTYLNQHGEVIFNIILDNQDEIYKACLNALELGHSRYTAYLSLSKEYEQAFQK